MERKTKAKADFGTVGVARRSHLGHASKWWGTGGAVGLRRENPHTHLSLTTGCSDPLPHPGGQGTRWPGSAAVPHGNASV